MVSLRICGPKFSLCCSLISIWGVIMLPIMGLLLSKHSLTFAEDLVEDIKVDNVDEFLDAAAERYDEAAKTCYYASAIYLGSLIFSVWQFYLNQKNSNKR